MIDLVHQTEVWLPTWQGWFVLAIALSLGIGLGIRRVYPFLSVNRPVEADVAIVEGWIPDDCLKAFVDELRPYRLVITTGFPIPYGRYLSGYENFAQVAADTLVFLGLPPETVIPVPHGRVERDRTLASAIGVQEWLDKNHPEIQAVNLYSLGPHARRSWLLFRKALQPVQVGIVSTQPRDYDLNCWWLTSSGTRGVLSEGIGYLYVRLIQWSR